MRTWRPGRSGTSARTRWPSARCDDSSRRTNALIVPIPTARPAQSSIVASSVSRSTISSTRSWYVVTVSPSTFHAPSSPTGSPSTLSFRTTLWITIVYCWRSSSASANTKGSSSPSMKSAIVQ